MSVITYIKYCICNYFFCSNQSLLYHSHIFFWLEVLSLAQCLHVLIHLMSIPLLLMWCVLIG